MKKPLIMALLLTLGTLLLWTSPGLCEEASKNTQPQHTTGGGGLECGPSHVSLATLQKFDEGYSIAVLCALAAGHAYTRCAGEALTDEVEHSCTTTYNIANSRC